MEKKCWFISGGAGFIGANFIKYIMETYPDDDVICFDKLTYAGNLNNIERYIENPRFKFIKGDICSESDVRHALENLKVDYLVNFAAETHVDKAILDPLIFIKTNVDGVGVLLNAVNEFKIPRFHQVSTDEVYGDIKKKDEKPSFKEDSALNPSSPYSASKAGGDLLCLSYFKTYGTPITISRCTNNYGIMQNEEKLIPNVISRLKRNEEIHIYGDGTNMRDWIHVMDHSRAIDLIVRNGRVGEIYNVAGNNEYSNNEIVHKILKIMDKPESLIKYVEDRPGHDFRYSLNCSKIEKELGFARFFDFDDSIEEVVKWYLEN